MQIITVSTAYRGESGQAILVSYWPINELRVASDNHPETYQYRTIISSNSLINFILSQSLTKKTSFSLFDNVCLHKFWE